MKALLAAIIFVAVGLFAISDIYAGDYKKPRHQQTQQHQKQGQHQKQKQAQSSYNKNILHGGNYSGGNATAHGGQGGNVNLKEFNHLSIEGDHYPEFVSSAAPVVGTDCTYGSSLQDKGYGGAATFPSPVCNLFTAAHYHYEQEQYYLSLARVFTDKAIQQKYAFDDSLVKSGRVRPEAKQEIVKTAMQAESYYDQALYHMEEKNRLKESGVAKLKRLAVTGEIGGHITGIIPILGAIKVTD